MFGRRLSTRVLFIAGAAALIGFACAVGMARILSLRAQSAAAEALKTWASAERIALCASSPDSFSLPMPNGARAFAYDAVTKTSPNPAAPPLVLAGAPLPLATGEVRVTGQRVLRAVTVVLRARPAGACSLVAVSWPPRFRDGDSITIPAAMMAFVTFVMTALGFLIVVKPLIRRVEALRRAAEAVGDASYPALEPSADLDELVRIRVALDRAHARITQANTRLAERLRGLQEHLTNVAHDLRTPLASLQAHVEEALDTEPAPDVAASLKSALGDCVYLARLSENLRLASQLQEGWDPTGSGPIDLAATVARVAERLAHYARRRGISLQFAVPEAPVPVLCDPFACEQALGNIVENAVTHLPLGGRIGVVLDQLPAHGFVVTIVDDGPGVAPEELSRLGERTFRGDTARARDPRGSGLGLAIARAICERCGWSLEFSAIDEGGLRVDIRGRESTARD